MTRLNCIILSGSTRTNSYNMQLATLIETYLKEVGVQPTLLMAEQYDFPLYNGDLEEKSGLPNKARDLKQQFLKTDGFFITSPEYNSSITPLLKNTIDWISRPEESDPYPLPAFKDKVAAITSASPGNLGGLRGLVHLRMILGNIGCFVVPNQLAITKAHEAFDEMGHFTEAQNKKALNAIIQQWVQTATALKSNQKV